MVRRSRALSLYLKILLTAGVLFPGAAFAESVTIGAVLPMSGPHAAFGHMQENSMLMAVEAINSRGGIRGRLLNLDIRDSAGRIKKARAVIDHFVRDKQYMIVIGGFSSSVASSLAEKCEQLRIPLIVVTGSEDSITLQEYRYVFRISPPRSSYPAAALEFARGVIDNGRIALLTERSNYGDAMVRTVNAVGRDAGWVVAGEWRFTPGSRNLESLFSEALESRPGTIFLTAFPPDGARIVRELRDRIPNAVVFNLVPASTLAGSYAQCGASCRDVLNPSLWEPEALESAVRYRETYLARFGSEPDYHGAQAHAAVWTAARAIRSSGSEGAEGVRKALESISVKTVYGDVHFRDRDGFVNQNDPPNYLVRWNGSAFELAWPRDLETP